MHISQIIKSRLKNYFKFKQKMEVLGDQHQDQ